MRAARGPTLQVVAIAAWACVASAARAEVPAELPGLVAWYRADSLGSMTHGEAIPAWRDSSAGGHDLTHDDNGPAAVYRADQAGGHSAVRVNAGSYSVTNPFELGSHTVFLVYTANAPERALFRSEANPRLGVLLRHDGDIDLIVNGGMAQGEFAPYGVARASTAPWTLAVIGRDSGVMHGEVDGSASTSEIRFDTIVRVGTMFDLDVTTFVGRDGEGLKIAEMIFYDRWLADDERARVRGYLGARYALDVGTAPVVTPAPEPVALERHGLALLSTTTTADLNGPGVAIPWTEHDELDPPFAHDAEQAPTRLVCTRDGTVVRLFAQLPVDSVSPGVNVRALFRVNGGRFLRGEGRSGPFGGEGAQESTSIAIDVVTTLNAGDWVEVVTLKAGAAGTVRLAAGAALFLAEER